MAAEAVDDIPTFKLVLVGDGGTGKTTFVKRHLTGEFEKKYIATLGVEVHPLVFHTIVVKFVSMYGTQPAKKSLVDFEMATTFKASAPLLLRVCENIPMVLVGNKVDVKDRKVKAKALHFIAKRIYSITMFRQRATTTLKSRFYIWHESLLAALAPPEVHLDAKTIAEYEEQIKLSGIVDMPDDDDDI
uniref:GTP-binding nuclear protein Ran n=1 Tax=Ditylenchus dipsaci TaxID=166011 RepID=A0A915EH89_9BILA